MITSTPTNQAVGDAIGLTHSGVSRIRSGNRLPSLVVMKNIEKVYGWSLDSQVVFRTRGIYHYAREFNAVLAGDREDEAISA